mmetsp:Transcript_16486/g.19498  ORF Transcript_16486/g.19498 Transcript_16486/m.19498 type:complete len:491 (+) Transcript_16486:64-1536(+)
MSASTLETLTLDSSFSTREFLSPRDPLFWHGRGYNGPLEPPICTWKSDKPPRDDHDCPKWLTASEYKDTDIVEAIKIKELARLIRISRKTVLYTGAGISASAVGQAARSGQNKVGWKASPSEAKPTPTHYALGILGRHNLVHSWCQQNHDGLPQKAGFPQELLNEIHGSWFNPSNPVVKYSGTLYEPCYESMLDDASNADLIIVLGTSLGGLNADQVAIRTAERSLQLNHDGGTVCINLQQTPQDDKMTLRMFGKSDDILIHLLKELNINHDIKNDIKHNPASRGNSNSNSGAGGGSLNRSTPHWPTESRILIPYDKHGNLLKSFKLLKQEQQLKDGDQFNPTDRSAYQSILEKYHENNEQNHEKWMWLDLRNGSDIKLVSGHNCVGSGQPNFAKITHGRGTVVKRNDACCAFNLTIQGASMKLGLWWMDSALRGAVELLPVVNHNPEYQFPTINNNNSASEEKKNKKPSSSTVQRSPQNVRMSSRLSKK